VLGYQLPRTGKGYAGLIPYSPFNLYREYAQVKLTQSLIKNQVYHVEYFVNHSNRPGAFVSNVDAYFSTLPLTQGSYHYGLLQNVTHPPQIRNRSGLLKDTLNWMKIEGNFMAEGGEQYLTIGNFYEDAQTNAIGEPHDAYYYLDDVSVRVASCPVVNDLGPDRVLCSGNTFWMDATFPGAIYQWQDGSTQARYQVQSPGTYWVDVQLGDCSLRDSIQVRYMNPQSIDLLKDTTRCYTTQAITLSTHHPDALNYYWDDGSRQSTRSFLTSGTYWVDIEVGGCTFRDSVRVLFLDQQKVLSHFYAFCDRPVLLDARTEGATAYLWQNGSTNPTFLATTPGDYSVRVENGNCRIYHYTRVDYANADIFPDQAFSLCPGESTRLEAYPGQGPYRWQDGSTADSYVVDKPGKYWVEYWWYGCQFRDSVQVSYYPQPPRSFPREVALCREETRLLDAAFQGSPFYQWQDGSYLPSMTVQQPGLYWVQFSQNGCTFRDSVQVRYFDDFPHPLPKTLSLCPGETGMLDASAVKGAFYRWQDGTSFSSHQVSQAGTYWVEFPWQDCRVRDSTVVNILPATVVEIEIDTVFCYGRSAVLRARGTNQTYSWSDGSQGSELVVKEAGTYWVEGRDKLTACLTRQTITLEPIECWENLVIPNVITPNGDVHNQYFVIRELTNHWNLEITDRWGHSVYRSSSYANDWDAAGRESGLYYYFLKNYVSGQQYKGWLQVLH
jgi:gliding motility-associated-like protein